MNKAERLYTALLQHHPDNFDALHGLGQLNYQRGRLDAALALIQAALKTDLSRADGFASLGLGVSCAGAIRAGAQRAMTRACASRRTTPSCSTGAAWRCSSLAVRARRSKTFDRAAGVRSHPLSTRLGNRGNALLKLNRAAEALAAYDRALGTGATKMLSC